MLTHNTIYKRINKNKKYIQKDDYKPKGLWYSKDHAWIKWCEHSFPSHLEKNNIILKLDYSNILIIETKEDLNNFIEKYIKIDKITETLDLAWIDWKKVSEDHYGIEFKNYNYLKYSLGIGEALQNLWFSTLDCSSGCIWDLKVIVHQKLLTKNEISRLYKTFPKRKKKSKRRIYNFSKK